MPDDASRDRINPAPSGDAAPTPAPSGRGGRRPGAGRPKGSRDGVLRATPQRKATFREVYESEVEKNQRKIVEAAVKASLRGDSRMLMDMVNRFVGPAKTALEISGPNGAPVQLQAMTAAALATLSSEQLHALLQVHQQLGIAPSGDDGSSPLSLPQPLGLLPPDHDASDPSPDPDPSTPRPGFPPETPAPLPQTHAAEGEEGGSPDSQPTADARRVHTAAGNAPVVGHEGRKGADPGAAHVHDVELSY